MAVVAVLCVGAFALAVYLNAELQRLRNRLRALERRPTPDLVAADVAADLASLRKERDALRQELAQILSREQRLRERADLLQRTVEPRQTLIDELTARATALEVELRRAQDAQRQAIEASAGLRREMERLASENEQMRNQLSDLTHKLAAAQTASADAGRRASELEAQLRAALQRAEKAEAVARALESAAAEATANAKKQIEALAAERDRLAAEKAALEQRLNPTPPAAPPGP